MCKKCHFVSLSLIFKALETSKFRSTSIFFFSYRYERHLVFPKLFATKCSDFSNENMIFNADDRKQGTARRYLCNRLSDNVNIYTLEVSMNGFFIKGTNIITPYTEADCEMMMMQKTLFELFLKVSISFQT
jgi:hypothetical protein